MTKKCRLRSGVAIKDVVVLMALVALLPATLGVVVDWQKEAANRVRCAKNLQQIGMGLILYGNENRGAFPRTNYRPNDAPTAFTNYKPPVPHPFLPDGPRLNDVTAALYMLATTQEVPISSFICPSSSARPINFGQTAEAEMPKPTGEPVGEHAGVLTNFPSVENLSYSIANPYPSSDAVAKGYRWNMRMEKGLPLVADLNPGTDQVIAARANTMPPYLVPNAGPAPRELPAAQLAANSPNHSGLGQNIIYADGHVEFQPTPFAGLMREGRGRDNIYTRNLPSPRPAGEDPIQGSPMDGSDSVLLPTAKKAI